MGGIINRGGHVKITGQAIGNQNAGKGRHDSGRDDQGGKGNTGIVNRGGKVTVTNSTVNGRYVEHEEY